MEGDELGNIDCGHGYHVSCIQQWLVQKNQCPICKAVVLAFMVRGLSLFHHFSLLTHCGGGLLFSDRGCTPALFVPAYVQADCCLWFHDTSWMSSVQLCILLVVPSSIVLVSIVPPSGKSRDIDVWIEL